MTPMEQVKKIIVLLNPENPDEQTDAVFLVERTLKKLREKLHAKDKQIAMLEEELVKARKDALILSNEKREIQETHAKQIAAINADEPVIIQTSIEEKQPEANDGQDEEKND